MLCDIVYQSGNANTKWKDYITFVYKDLITKEKQLYTIEEPTITLYEVPPERRTFKKARHFKEIKDLIPHEVKYKDVLKEIANIAGPQFVKYYNERKTKAERKQLLKWPYCLGGDIPIETIYRSIWEKELGNSDRKDLTCIYLDIEVNQKHWTGPIPRKGECPIDMISVFDETQNTCYTFYLKVEDNPQIIPFINNRQQELQQKLHERFDELFPNATYKQYAFDDESELLKQVFTLIHYLKRDICFIWNMDFDMPYIIDRATNLKMNPANLLCHSDFPTSTLYYFQDTRTFDFDKKRSYLECTSYTHYLDQPTVYSSLRKSQGTLRKVNLNAIAQREIDRGKVKFEETGGNFVEFSYNDFMLYDIYNVNDVLLQGGINQKCNDAFTIYNSSYNSYCNYKDALKQSVSLRSLFYHEFLKDGLILGHNVNYDMYVKNQDSDEDEEGYEGAINGDPELNDFTGVVLYGKKSMYLFVNCIDFDFSAMYPNTICCFNIFATTMIGKLYIEDGEKYLNYDEDPGKEFVEDMIAQIPLFLGHKWFGLPCYMELDRMVSSCLKSGLQ